MIVFEKDYFGFEHFADFERDVCEAVNSDFNPVMKQIKGEFQGIMRIRIEYIEESENAEGKD